MDLIGSELCKTFQFCGVSPPPGGFAPAGPSPRFARSGAPQKQRLRRDQGLRPSSPKGSTLTQKCLAISCRWQGRDLKAPL